MRFDLTFLRGIKVAMLETHLRVFVPDAVCSSGCKNVRAFGATYFGFFPRDFD